jgi:hypothetical protein
VRDSVTAAAAPRAAKDFKQQQMTQKRPQRPDKMN